MHVRCHDDVGEFLTAAAPLLHSDPFTTSVITVVAERAVADPFRRTDCLWITVEDDDARMLGVAMHTPPFPAFLARMPEAAAAAVADALLDAGHTLPGVNGVCDCARVFSDVWTKRTGQTAEVVYSMRMYALETLTMPACVSGRASPAPPGTAVRTA